MVRVDIGYRCTGPGGPARLVDRFVPVRQLIVQHVVFDPSPAGEGEEALSGRAPRRRS